MKRLNKPIGEGGSNYCEILATDETDMDVAKIIIAQKFLKAVIEHGGSKNVNSERTPTIEIKLVKAANLDYPMLAIKFNNSGKIMPQGDGETYVIASRIDEPYKNSQSSIPSAESEIREEIAKLAKEIYRLKSAGKVHPTGISDMEANVKGLYAKITKAGV